MSCGCVDAEFVVAAFEVLDERVSPDHSAGSSLDLEPSYWSEPGFQAPVIAFDAVVGVLLSVMERTGSTSPRARAKAGARSVVTSLGVIPVSIRR